MELQIKMPQTLKTDTLIILFIPICKYRLSAKPTFVKEQYTLLDPQKVRHPARSPEVAFDATKGKVSLSKEVTHPTHVTHLTY